MGLNAVAQKKDFFFALFYKLVGPRSRRLVYESAKRLLFYVRF